MAQRDDWFLMRISADERRLIQTLAQREGTSASKAVRKAIQQALKEERTSVEKTEVLLTSPSS